MQQTRTSLSFSAARTRRSPILDRDFRRVSCLSVRRAAQSLNRSPRDLAGRLLHVSTRVTRRRAISDPSLFKYVAIH